MTPQELKNSILQLAIQGKLVEQRAEEGTAAELVEKILAAKNAKGAKGSLTRSRGGAENMSGGSRAARRASSVPSVPVVPPIPDDEKPFDIPESWEWVRLGEVCTIDRGGSPRPIKDYITTAADGINWIKIGDTEKDGKYICSTAEKIKPSGVSKSRMVHAGDFLLTNSMSFGRPYILKVNGCIHDGWLVISQGEEIFDQDYLYWVLSSGYAYSQFCAKVSGAVVKNLNSDKVANSVFPLPPLAEQKRIVAKIEELLPLIDRYEKAWSKLEDFNRRFPVDMQKSLLQMAIQGKLVEQRAEEGTGEELLEKILAAKNAKGAKKNLTRSRGARGEKSTSALSASPREVIPDDEKPFDIPESWEWVRLGEIATVLGGKRIPAGRQLTTENTGHIYIRVSDMKNDGVSTEHLMYVPSDIYPSISRYIITKEDVYITVAGTIGRVGKIPPELDGANLTENADRLVFESIDQEWLVQCLKSVVVQNQILDCTTKVGQPKLAIKRIQELIIPLPPLAEQKRIVAKLEEILPLCERLK